MDIFYECPICGNKDPKYIGYRNNVPYCRKCISFRGEEASHRDVYPREASFELSYSLSKEQEKLSNSLINNYKEGIESLVYAVCGSGKTEIVLHVIKYAIECGDKVGFAIPRKDVVIEIADRFREIFISNKICAVYGGNTIDIEGDLIVLTTHQLFRYQYYFDLLIIDEIDAFPFNGNDILNTLFKRSVKGHYILMSATPSDEILKEFRKPNFKILELFSRFHGHLLPVPKIIVGPSFYLIVKLNQYVKEFLNQEKPIFIFCPTIDICEQIFKILRVRFKTGNYVHSKREGRLEIVDDFKHGKIKFLVTTAVLERGITIKNLQVIIYRADHKLYDSHALVQISGRVGRKKDAPDGEVIFLANESNREIEKSIEEIERANKNLQALF